MNFYFFPQQPHLVSVAFLFVGHSDSNLIVFPGLASPGSSVNYPQNLESTSLGGFTSLPLTALVWKRSAKLGSSVLKTPGAPAWGLCHRDERVKRHARHTEFFAHP